MYCRHFNTNDEVGNMTPTATEMHVLTKVKKVGYETPLRIWYPFYIGVRSTCAEMSNIPFLVVSDSSLKI
eukprot:5056982-Amphidinium_carterae.1